MEEKLSEVGTNWIVRVENVIRKLDAVDKKIIGIEDIKQYCRKCHFLIQQFKDSSPLYGRTYISELPIWLEPLEKALLKAIEPVKKEQIMEIAKDKFKNLDESHSSAIADCFTEIELSEAGCEKIISTFSAIFLEKEMEIQERFERERMQNSFMKDQLNNMSLLVNNLDELLKTIKNH